MLYALTSIENWIACMNSCAACACRPCGLRSRLSAMWTAVFSATQSTGVVTPSLSLGRSASVTSSRPSVSVKNFEPRSDFGVRPISPVSIGQIRLSNSATSIAALAASLAAREVSYQTTTLVPATAVQPALAPWGAVARAAVLSCAPSDARW
jgi:hypothetical protein